MDARVEPASGTDIGAVTECWAALATEQRRHGSPLLGVENRAAMRETIAAIHQEGGVFVARADGDVVGFVTVTRERGALATDRDRAILSNLYVLRDFRGNGLGTALLEAAETRCREWGVDAVGLEVLAANDRARAFYRERGYALQRLHLERPLEGDGESGD